MTELPEVYLIDRLENLAIRVAHDRRFAPVVDFIRAHRLEQLEPGRHEIVGSQVFVNVDETDYVAPADRRAELHRRYFDIHVPLGDEEVIGLARFDPTAEGAFDEAHDVGFYRQDVAWYTLKRGEFAITWPNSCLHAPACTYGAPHRARKLIFKIASD